MMSCRRKWDSARQATIEQLSAQISLHLNYSQTSSVGRIFPAEKLNEIRWRNYLVKETQLLLRIFATLFLLKILKIRNPK